MSAQGLDFSYELGSTRGVTGGCDDAVMVGESKSSEGQTTVHELRMLKYLRSVWEEDRSP